MRVFLDENLPAFIAEPLAHVYPQHRFATSAGERLTGASDLELLRTLRARAFDAFVTRDRAQLRDPDERAAVMASGLRWIGIRDKKLAGVEFMTVTVATLVAGLRLALEHEPEVPSTYELRTIPHGASQLIRVRPL